MKLVLIGDGDSPHLLKWARMLAPRVELYAASSRGFLAGFDDVLPPARRLALGTRPEFEGGNIGLVRELPRLARWLKAAHADWLHAHYLTSHGTLAWLALAFCGVPGRLVSSAWGSDVLVAPQRSGALRWLTRRVLKASALTTSDSADMADRMRALGAGEVMLLPFGLEALPPAPPVKDDGLFFANRGLEPLYAPHRVLELFAEVTGRWPHARLVVANDGSLRAELEARAAALGLATRVRFVGRLDAAAQVEHYAAARWYVSLPATDALSVSVLEAMAHGCIPLLSDLPANRELVVDGDNGCIVGDAASAVAALERLLPRADAIGRRNRDWVAANALFAPAVDRFLARLRVLQDAG